MPTSTEVEGETERPLLKIRLLETKDFDPGVDETGHAAPDWRAIGKRGVNRPVGCTLACVVHELVSSACMALPALAVFLAWRMVVVIRHRRGCVLLCVWWMIFHTRCAGPRVLLTVRSFIPRKRRVKLERGACA